MLSFHIEETVNYPSFVEVNATGRYIRVQLVERTYLHLAQIEVYAKTSFSEADSVVSTSTSYASTVDKKEPLVEKFDQDITPEQLTILDHSPISGAPGTIVFLVVDQSVIQYSQVIKAYYNGVEIDVFDIIEDVVAVVIPKDAASGNISLGIGNSISNDVAFTVAEISLKTLFEKNVAQSTQEQIVTYKNENDEVLVTVRMPPAILTTDRTVTIKEVSNLPQIPIMPLETRAIDITIDDLSALDDYIEIGFAYNPEVLDPDIGVAEQLAFYKFDEKHNFWMPLPIKVDETAQMVYIKTDHLCFLLGFSWSGFGALLKTLLWKPVLCAAIYEKFAYSLYFTPQRNFRISYHRRSLKNMLKAWNTPSRINHPLPTCDQYPTFGEHPMFIQEIGELFEMALKNYVEVQRFKNPARKPGRLWGETHTPITVKISGIYGMIVNEPLYEKWFGVIHIPSWLFSNYVEINKLGPGEAELEDEIYKTIGHELFHKIQAEYYRFHRFMKSANTGDFWWLEATAEFAGGRNAWGVENRTLEYILEYKIQPDILSHPLNTCDYPPGWERMYEYAMAVFVRYLVDVKGFNFKEMFEYVSASEPFDGLDSFIVSKDSENYLGAYFADYARWVLFSKKSFIKSHATNKVASKFDTIALLTDENLTIEVTSSDEPWVEIYKGDNDSRSSIGERLALLGYRDNNELVIPYADLSPDNYIYVLGINKNRFKDSNFTVNITGDNENSSIDLTYSFALKRPYTAKIWALQIIIPSWKLTRQRLIQQLRTMNTVLILMQQV